MTDRTATPHTSSDGLGRWLLGGLASGVVILGLLIAAYAIGYHRGQHHPRSAAASAAAPETNSATTTAPTAATTSAAPSAEPVPITAALVARGRSLYESDGCSACHSLSGSAGVGPGFKALAGSSVSLSNGQTVTADDVYLQQSIADPDAQIVKGYRGGVMPAAIASYDLDKKPNDIRALVAFIKSTK